MKDLAEALTIFVDKGFLLPHQALNLFFEVFKSKYGLGEFHVMKSLNEMKEE